MTRFTTITTLSLGALLITSQGAALIEESFEYEDGPVSGLDGGAGFDSPWSNTRNNPTVSAPDLTWGDLLTSGGSSRGGAWSALVRPLDSSLADAGLLDGATLWFSVIFDLEGQNTTNADLNLCLGTSGFVPGTFGDRENLDSGEGIGVTHSRARIQGVYWQAPADNAVAARAENDSSTIINGDADAGNLSRALIVGRIDWGDGEDADETLTLYAPGEDLELGDPTMAEWAIPALDQSAFDQLALQYKDTPRMDEVRFGATSADVLPTAAGPPVAPTITSISRVGDDLYELTINASAGTAFTVIASESLDFENGAALVTGLTPGDAGTIGGASEEIVTTDEEGQATFQMTSATARNFVRIQPPVEVGP